MNVPVTVPVIVIQTDSIAFGICRKLFEKAKLIEGQDIILTDMELESPEDMVVAGERQLLVTGTFSGDEEAAADYVIKLKAKNPKLEVWFFTVMRPRSIGWYDRYISKSSGHYGNLAGEIQKFLGR